VIVPAPVLALGLVVIAELPSQQRVVVVVVVVVVITDGLGIALVFLRLFASSGDL